MNKINCTLTVNGDEASQVHGMHVVIDQPTATARKSVMGHQGIEKGGIVQTVPQAGAIAIIFDDGEHWLVRWEPGAKKRGCGCGG